MRKANLTEAPRRHWWLLLLFLVVAALLSIGPLSERPTFIHGWTQTDRLALALGFLHNGMDLFHPQTYNLLTTEGITAVDLPLSDYLAAGLMKLLGDTAPALFRLVTLLFSLLGLWQLYRWTFRATKSSGRAFFAAAFLLCAPAYTYYQTGFIPTIPAIAASLWAYAAFFRYLEKYELKYLWQLMIALALAALVRKPFLMVTVAIFVHMLCYALWRKLPWWHLVAPLLAGSAFFGYLLWTQHLAETYGSMFLTDFMPATDAEHFNAVLSEMTTHWGLEYFSLPQWILLFALVAVLLVTLLRSKGSRSKVLTAHLLQFSILSVGAFAYFLLMLAQFHDHDYYFIDTFYLPILLLLICCLTVYPPETRVGGKLTRGFAVLAFLIFAHSSYSVQQERYTAHRWDMVDLTWQEFAGADQWLDEQDVGRDEAIIVLDAYSTNVPLIQADRMGYTILHTKEENLKEALDLPADWILSMRGSVLSEVYSHWNGIANKLELVASNEHLSLFRKQTSAGGESEFMSLLPVKSDMESRVLASSFQFTPEVEFGPTFVDSIATFLTETGDSTGYSLEKQILIYEVRATIPHKLHDMAVVLSVQDQESGATHYVDYPMYAQPRENGTDWTYAYEFHLPEGFPRSSVVKAYLHNRGGNTFETGSVKVWLCREKR